MKRKRRWLLGPLLILALLLCAIPASADTPTIPHAFYGTLTIGGSAAPVGTVVTAEVDEVECGSITTTVAGQYGGSGAFDARLCVSGDIATGATIKFYVGGNEAGETYAFNPGIVTELNLTVTDTTAPSVTITALTPDPTRDNTPTFTGTATDSLSSISSVEYKVDSGSWTAASASDGAFDSVSESYTFTTAELIDGAHTVYVRATDAATNTTAEADYASDGFTVDATAPTVSSTLPVADAPDVAVDTVVSATFSETMDESTITASSFTLVIERRTSVSGTVSYDSGTNTATFTPSADLDGNTTYTATLSTVITDTVGNPLAAEYSWDFTTSGDLTVPTVSSTSPAADATDVATYTTVTVTFDMAMDESTITTSSFTLDSVAGTVSYDSGTNTATFTPDANLDPSTETYTATYTATLSTAITSAEGIALASAYSWSFTAVIAGDATEEGLVDSRDITKVERIIAGLDTETPGADANQDGSVNALDITKVERIIAGLD